MIGPEVRRGGICIVGGGPAGSMLAARLAQLGHDVTLIERVEFPRARVGESLTPGVLPLLDSVGVCGISDAAWCRTVRGVHVAWDASRDPGVDASRPGLLVDRGRFDAMLLGFARALGVQVLQPAVVREQRHDERGWHLVVERGARRVVLRPEFIADARGRSSLSFTRSPAGGCRTVALYAYWTGCAFPLQPRIVTGPEEWCWGVPLPDGTYNTMVFVDRERIRARGAGRAGDLFQSLVSAAGLLDGYGGGLRLASPVSALEATPYLAADSVTGGSIKVGDAALAIDPLSSSGVQKAIQTALSAAVVVNTILRRPASRAAACRFYRATLEQAGERHRVWTAAQYAAVAVERGTRFWCDRAAAAAVPATAAPPSQPTRPTLPFTPAALNAPVILSPLLDIIDHPCLDGDFVVEKETVLHPALDGPTAYAGGVELVPLLRRLRPGMTPLELAGAWAPLIPLPVGLQVALWLADKGLIVPTNIRPAVVASDDHSPPQFSRRS